MPPIEAEVDETTLLLIRARGLVERGWCRGISALDSDGATIEPQDEAAVCWCAYGALIAASWRTDVSNEAVAAAFDRFQAAIGGENILDFNDSQETVEPVLAAFDRAIMGIASTDQE
jgi:hypothetical protein